MVQIRLLTLLAATFALHFSGRSMTQQYQENQAKMKEDPGAAASKRSGPGPEELHSGSDLLADLHATSCGLKSLASTIAGEGLETARRACGGHGYSDFSGIGTYYADYLPTLTWEGDNYMLTQQVARYVSPLLSLPPSPPHHIILTRISPPAPQIRPFRPLRREIHQRHHYHPLTLPLPARHRRRLRHPLPQLLH